MENLKMSRKKMLSFLVLMLAAGTMYKIYFLIDVFYVQMQEFMGLSHTQLGVIYSFAGWVSQFGFLAATYFSDRFPKRKIISFALVANGIAGLFISSFPTYPILFLLFCLCAVFTDMLCWPIVLKTIRLLGTDDQQGRMFGFLETGRGLIDTVVNFAALGITVALGSGAIGFRWAIIFFSAISIIIGILALFVIEDDSDTESVPEGEKNRLALSGVKEIFKDKGVWLVALNIFTIYSLYSGLKYFVPFLKNIYNLPVALASTYGIINMYGLKMIGGPIGGIVSDKVTHSAAKFIRIMFIISVVAIGGYSLIPHDGSLSVYVVMSLSLIMSAFIFCMRAIFFAPMDEVKVPRNLTGAAMSLGSFVGYLPGAFISIIYGSQLDAHPGVAGYRRVFILMTIIAVVGVVLSSLLIKEINKRKNLTV